MKVGNSTPTAFSIKSEEIASFSTIPEMPGKVKKNAVNAAKSESWEPYYRMSSKGVYLRYYGKSRVMSSWPRTPLMPSTTKNLSGKVVRLKGKLREILKVKPRSSADQYGRLVYDARHGNGYAKKGDLAYGPYIKTYPEWPVVSVGGSERIKATYAFMIDAAGVAPNRSILELFISVRKKRIKTVKITPRKLFGYQKLFHKMRTGKELPDHMLRTKTTFKAFPIIMPARTNGYPNIETGMYWNGVGAVVFGHVTLWGNGRYG